MARLALHSVHKTYPNGYEAVVDLSLEADDGEFLVLVGPSGCGKSTVLRLIAGLEECTKGEIRIGDRPVNGLVPQQRDTAMIFQNYALYPQMTVAQNMGFALRMHRVAKAAIGAAVSHAAGILHLGAELSKKPGQLSGGQRQRVAMGRAIVREPSMFLMDEPLSNLDAQLRVQVRAEISKLQRDLATTTVYVTHDQVEAMTMGHRVAVMRGGRLLQVDSPQNLYDRPADTFVASFLGAPPMNLLRGVLTVTADGGTVRIGESDLALQQRHLGGLAPLVRRGDREVIVGLRPEDLSEPAQPGDNAPDCVQGTVRLIEQLGSEVLLHLSVGAAEDGPPADPQPPGGDLAANSSVVARMPRGYRATPGDRVLVRVDQARLYFFDPATGQAIPVGA